MRGKGSHLLTALALALALTACSGSEDRPRAPQADPPPEAPEPRLPAKPPKPPVESEPEPDPEAERILAVSRQPADAPLADLSHYAPRRAGRAADASLNARCQGNTRFQYGAGLGDITGVAHGLGMLGYADTGQTSEGIHNRQFARAFAFGSHCGGRDGHAVIVSLDQGLMFHAVRQGVLDALRDDAEDDLGSYYGAHNVLLNVTHTHASAGGQAHHDLYNLTTGGHDTSSYEAIVAGTVDAIRRAHRNLLAAEPGPIRFAQGELLNTIVQRSAPAYALNPPEERQRFVDEEGREVSVNRMMTLLRLTRDDGSDVGMLNWFAIHGTSMAQTNKLLSGDNKGYAAWRFERGFGTDYFADDTFVAGFFQADEGDNSPNIFITDLSERELRDLEGDGFRTRGGGVDDFDSTMISGYKQYHKARELWDGAKEKLRGEVAAATIEIDFSRVKVTPSREYPPALAPERGGAATCQPALGISFASGAEDGRGPFSEGQACPVSLTDLGYVTRELNRSWTAMLDGALPSAIAVPIGCGNPLFGLVGYDCHAEKPVVIPLAVSPFLPTQGLAPSVLPLQIVTLGNLAIIGLPWEVTTMSGRRLREAVLDVLEDAGINYAVVAGVSNGYIHYLTTREEYASQQYEGASTVFGPWTQEAVQQELVRLAGHLRAGTQPQSPFAVEGFRSRRSLLVRIPFDSDGLPSQPFGSVVQQPLAEYRLAGDAKTVVLARFVGGHPRRDLKRGGSYLFVERWADRQWRPVASDHDWHTRFRFRERADRLTNHAIVEWRPPADTPPGVYRIRHEGASRDGPYSGVTDVFRILAD